MSKFSIRASVVALTTLAAAAGMAGAASASDAAAGKAVFASQCAMCHTVVKGGLTILGPNLNGVIGRKSGTVAGFAYSAAMKKAGITWSDDNLKAYLPAPQQLVPGTKMAFAGLKDPAKVDNVIAFLKTQK
jgi:cytochrome c